MEQLGDYRLMSVESIQETNMKRRSLLKAIGAAMAGLFAGKAVADLPSVDTVPESSSVALGNLQHLTVDTLHSLGSVAPGVITSGSMEDPRAWKLWMTVDEAGEKYVECDTSTEDDSIKAALSEAKCIRWALGWVEEFDDGSSRLVVELEGPKGNLDYVMGLVGKDRGRGHEISTA